MQYKLLLFDLDGTLLRSDKTISPKTREALALCRERGILIGVCTSRSEQKCLPILQAVNADVVISSNGAMVKYRGQTIHSALFSPEETAALIPAARQLCGDSCEITVDTESCQYWNYKIDPSAADPTWGASVYTDYTGFYESAQKICVETADEAAAARLAAAFPAYTCLRFSGTDWYQFTRQDATKETGIRVFCDHMGIPLSKVAAFGDDDPDIGMLKLCGTGIAISNADEAVKAAADLVIGTNDEDGIAQYLVHLFSWEG